MALMHDEALICPHVAQLLGRAAGPGDLDQRRDFLRSKAEVNGRENRGRVTYAAGLQVPLRADAHHRADCVAVALRADELQFKPMT